MPRRPGEIPDGFRRALEALHSPLRPMTGEELVEFEKQKAREMARAEAARQPTPQLPLDIAA